MDSEMLGMIAVSVIGALIIGVICGFICLGISSSRGMKGGYWWGFFLGIIGEIVVAVKPNDNRIVSPVSSPYEDLERLAQLKEQGVLSDDEYAKMKADCLSRIK